MFARLRSFILTVLSVLMATPVLAASHREAPMIANDPAADITDFYFFRSWQDPDKAILIMNVIPGQEPGSGPNYFNFADDVLYEIHIDNNKNNIAGNITYQIRFKTEIRQPGNVFPLAYVALPPSRPSQAVDRKDCWCDKATRLPNSATANPIAISAPVPCSPYLPTSVYAPHRNTKSWLPRAFSP
jgi:hypothetical protein